MGARFSLCYKYIASNRGFKRAKKESMQGSIQEYSKLEFAVKLSAMADGSQATPWGIPDILIPWSF